MLYFVIIAEALRKCSYTLYANIAYLIGIGFFQNYVILLYATTADLGRQLEESQCKEQEVLSHIKRVRSLGIQSCDLSNFTFE